MSFFHKIKSSVSAIPSYRSDSDGDSAEETIVHKALLRFYTEKGEIPEWLGVTASDELPHRNVVSSMSAATGTVRGSVSAAGSQFSSSASRTLRKGSTALRGIYETRSLSHSQGHSNSNSNSSSNSSSEYFRHHTTSATPGVSTATRSYSRPALNQSYQSSPAMPTMTRASTGQNLNIRDRLRATQSKSVFSTASSAIDEEVSESKSGRHMWGRKWQIEEEKRY